MRTDSIGLINAFNAVSNNLTGIGTDRAKNNHVAIARSRRLTRYHLQALFEDELIRKAVCLFPSCAAKAWFKLSIPNNKLGNNMPELLLRYISNLGNRSDKTEVEKKTRLYGAKKAFKRAAILARQFGKAYILIGIDDNKSFEESVDEERINSIRWLKVYEDWQLHLERTGDQEGYYRELRSGVIIHRSRVLIFWGNEIYSEFGNSLEEGESIIQSMFDAYIDWIQGIKAGSSMLTDYDTFTLGMKGLGQILLEDRQSGKSTGQEAVINRALALDMGKSVVRGIIYDMENEAPGSITRTYQGADAIMKSLESRWVAVSGIPRSKLFGELGAQGLTNNQGLAMRSEWALLVQNYADDWIENLEILLKYAFLAKDSPSNGRMPDSFDLIPKFDLQLTDTEKMEYEKKAGDRSKLLVDMGAITAEEVRSGYSGSTFSPDIVLSEKTSEPIKKQLQTDSKADILTDKEWEEFANISAQDFINTAEGIADAGT